ncbi:hypothetical protein Agub_g14644 [Astrephomene gubernaculifera]|uniref:N-acetylglucosaminylphosphatidylinositol deacetylase n=1 Tax=Astrephomene gubernaculifera TaxID=47775 RepID=A0AAD3HSF5_9CHLO|nr:hypothetical protein Agub_g14644 [Astrephomene gubernaculifera]
MYYFLLAILLLTIYVWQKFRRTRTWRPGHRALLVTAHPDDESLFFAPYLTRALQAGIQVHILCLSTGNADGLGSIRARELVQACAVFQVPEQRVRLVNDGALQDGFQAWDEGAVKARVAAALAAVRPHELVTFDAGGVSGHPNHTSIYAAVWRLVGCRGLSASQGDGHEGGVAGSDGSNRGSNRNGDSCCRICTLVTHPLPLKFTGVLGAALVLLLSSVRLHGRSADVRLHDSAADTALLLSSANPVVGLRAMWCHRSQFVWYRWLFVLFSTYTYVNQFRVIGAVTY